MTGPRPIGPTAEAIGRACVNYCLTRFPAGHTTPAHPIDQEWFADAAQRLLDEAAARAAGAWVLWCVTDAGLLGQWHALRADRRYTRCGRLVPVPRIHQAADRPDPDRRPVCTTCARAEGWHPAGTGGSP